MTDRLINLGITLFGVIGVLAGISTILATLHAVIFGGN